MNRISKARAARVAGAALLCAVGLDWQHNRRNLRIDIFHGNRRVGSICDFDEVEDLLDDLDLITLHEETQPCSAASESRASGPI